MARGGGVNGQKGNCTGRGAIEEGGRWKRRGVEKNDKMVIEIMENSGCYETVVEDSENGIPIITGVYGGRNERI